MSLLNVTLLHFKLFQIRSMPQQNDGIFNSKTKQNLTRTHKTEEMQTEEINAAKVFLSAKGKENALIW